MRAEFRSLLKPSRSLISREVYCSNALKIHEFAREIDSANEVSVLNLIPSACHYFFNMLEIF